MIKLYLTEEQARLVWEALAREHSVTRSDIYRCRNNNALETEKRLYLYYAEKEANLCELLGMVKEAVDPAT